jgi:CubicO group peptidase (beta-lactamase class C family)
MKLLRVVSVLCAVMAAVDARAQAAAAKADDVSAQLREIIRRHDLPGMVAAVVEGDRVVASGAAGVRVRGGRDAVTLADKFHLGSCTKALTATLCAILVEEGKLRWDSTVGDVFPSAKTVHPGFRKVTLEQLLNQRSGVPGEVDPQLWASLWAPKGVAARRKVLETVFARPPQAEPGTQYVYSNFNYALAGHMAETVARKPWEDLMREKLFVPLGMTSAGFGAPRDAGNARQPRGHTSDGKPVEPTAPASDNPPAIGPAGTVHCSVGDWAKFVTLHLQGERGKAKLLKAETFKRLRTPPEGSSYAMGWLVGPSPLGKGVALNHAGSNRMWYAVTWVLPESDLAVLVMCNQGEPGAAAEKACDEASALLIRRQVGRKGAK